MTLWSPHFTKASWTGGSWGSGEFDPGDLSPEEIVLSLAYTRLREDATLVRIFTKDRLEMMDVRNPMEFRDLPRLQCYLGSLSEDRIASRLDDTELLVHFGIRYDASDAFRKVTPGEVGAPAVMRLVKRVLKVHQQLPVTIEGSGKELGMAANSNQEGGLSYILDVDETGSRLAVTLELTWRYRIKVEADSGKIFNQTF